MKPSPRRYAAVLSVLTVCLSLSACALPAEDTPSAETTTADLRAHYDALVVALQEELTALRAETYITSETLLSRIRALETALEELGATLPTVAETDTPPASSTEPSDTPEGETQPIVTPPSTETAEGSAPATDTLVDTPALTAPATLPDGSQAESPTSPDSDIPAPNDGAPLAYIITDGTVTVTGYREELNPDHPRLVIPNTLNGYPVTHIADNAFEGSSLSSVTLPATLTRIGWFAFSGCRELRTVTIPASVEHIDYGAFDACPRLTLYCPRGSYAARYAAASAIPFTEV